MRQTALSILNRKYGYSNFRPGQWEVMEQALQGRDTVVLMPTGGGKSLCFQIPALMGEGCCIVVSPLIALMNDQVSALRANGLPARAVNSLVTEDVNQAAFGEARNGALKLLYISPERLINDLEWLRTNVKVSLIAIDEAHCISQWGHDFRPVYTQLKAVKDAWPSVPVMALTATADRLTRNDIAQALGMTSPYMHIGSFDRPNLSLTVIEGSAKRDRVRVISQLIQSHPSDCGIVYCLSRAKTEDMCETLQRAGFKAGCYHAGMGPAERERTQRAFVEGRLQVICATIAFGMGIDKSNIRWVVHNNLPANIESYYQEIGRAGRDGMPADTILFYSYGDVVTRRDFLEQSGQKEINSRKLDFMQKYAEASVCRRRILLSYFNEEATHDCGNCDNCRNPRGRIDGSVLAQKAMSASIRTGENEPINVLIDILRGMRNQQLIAKGYDRLPTFGVGRDLDTRAWHSYMLQMVQLGLFDIQYEDRFRLKVTPLGRKVLKGEERIELAQYEGNRFELGKKTTSKETKQAVREVIPLNTRIQVNLKALRLKLADRERLADYMVISDATVAQLAEKMPDSFDALLKIEGMPAVKVAKYGKDILKTIAKETGKKGVVKEGYSPLLTKMLFDTGMGLQEIARVRGLQFSTVANHMIGLWLESPVFDIKTLLPPGVLNKVEGALNRLQPFVTAREEARRIMEQLHSGLGSEEDSAAMFNAQARYDQAVTEYREVLEEMKESYLSVFGISNEDFDLARRIHGLLNGKEEG